MVCRKILSLHLHIGQKVAFCRCDLCGTTRKRIDNGFDTLPLIPRVDNRNTGFCTDGPRGCAVHTAHAQQGTLGWILHRYRSSVLRCVLLSAHRTWTVVYHRFHRDKSEPAADAWQHSAADIRTLPHKEESSRGIVDPEGTQNELHAGFCDRISVYILQSADIVLDYRTVYAIQFPIARL